MKRIAILAMSLAAVPVFAQSGDDEGPGRGVARVSLINGDVSVKRGDSGDWTGASLNSPLVVDDRVFTGPNSRAELQFDYANMVRLASDSEARLAELEHRRYTVQIAHGLATFRVLRNSDADVEISTPSIAIRPTKRGSYRIEVRPDGTTAVAVRSGEADIYTPRGVEKLRSGHSLMARGSKSDPEFRSIDDLRDDDWDRWNNERDRTLERSRSYSYMSSDVYGAEDLDSYGDWVNVAPYGNVWSPRVNVGWAPYRAGRWVWLDWYGWTWVSSDPWGWAPYHYGRWFTHGSRWVWWPGGGVHVRHYWRPALVAFFGWDSYSGFNFGVGFGGGWGRVGWCPLAPYETYRPWYGRNYYGGYRGGRVDNSVHVVNNVNITNVYRNSRVSNGVTAVDGADFSAGRVTSIRTVERAHLDRASLVQGQVPVAPARESLRHSDRDITGRTVSAGNDGFYSRREIRGVERVSFDEQRRGIENIARRTADEGGRGSDGGRRGGEVRGGEVRGGDAAVRSADGGRRGEVRDSDSGATRSADGWRRVGESGGRASETRGADVGSIRSTDSGRRSAESTGRSSDSSDRGGWRRFGDPGTRSSESRGGESRGAEVRTSEPRGGDSTGVRSSDNSDRGGWRRFGDPGTRSSESRGSDSGRSSTIDTGSYRRSDDGGSRRSVDFPSRNDSGDRGSWRRSPDSGSGEVRVSPPVVRERGSSRSSDSGSWSRPSRGDAPPPSYSRGDSGGGRSSAPDMGGWGGRRGGDSGGAVRSAPSGDWGGRRGGDSGGGMRSAPSGGGGNSGGGGDSGGRRGGEGGGRSSGGGRSR